MYRTAAATPGRADYSAIVPKLTLAFIYIAIFEGAIKKWMIPSAYNFLIIARDAIAIVIVLIYFISNERRKTAIPISLLVAWSAMVITWGLVQLLFQTGSITAFLIGCRFWLLYIWFATTAAALLHPRDIARIGAHIRYITILMTPLIIFQHLSPPTHPINSSDTDRVEDIFVVVGGVVRTTGTFSFTLGYTCFLAAATPFCLAGSWKGYSLGPKWSQYLGWAAIGIGALMSGSRACILLAAFIGAVHALMSLGTARSTSSLITRVGAVALGTTVIILGATLGLSDQLANLSDRFQDASDSESVPDRVISMVAGERSARDNWVMGGAGLGSGANAFSVATTGSNSFLLAETEPGRVLLEMGLLGVIFNLGKVLVAALGIASSARIARMHSDPTPLLLWVSLSVALITWQISGQVSAHAFGYLLLLFSLVSLEEIHQNPHHSDAY